MMAFRVCGPGGTGFAAVGDSGLDSSCCGVSSFNWPGCAGVWLAGFRGEFLVSTSAGGVSSLSWPGLAADSEAGFSGFVFSSGLGGGGAATGAFGNVGLVFWGDAVSW